MSERGSLMMKGGHGQINQLRDINWGVLDHASRAPQLISCNYYILWLHVLRTVKDRVHLNRSDGHI